MSNKNPSAIIRAKIAHASRNRSIETKVRYSAASANRSNASKTKRLQTMIERNINHSKIHSKQCTVDGITIYPSRKHLIEEMGQGQNGSRSLTFRYI